MQEIPAERKRHRENSVHRLAVPLMVKRAYWIEEMGDDVEICMFVLLFLNSEISSWACVLVDRL